MSAMRDVIGEKEVKKRNEKTICWRSQHILAKQKEGGNGWNKPSPYSRIVEGKERKGGGKS